MAASVALVIMVAATNSVVSAARAITRDSSALSETDGAIRSATVARTLTVLAAVAVQDGSTPSSLAEARTAVDDLASGSDLSGPDRAFVDAIDATLTQLQQGIKATPQQVAAIENTFQALLDAQLSERSALAASLADSQQRLNQMSTLAGVALLFIIPAVAIFVYRGLTRPDATHARLIHQADIDLNDERNRRSTLAKRIAAMEADLERASKSELQCRLAELAALAGPGLGGAAHDRIPVDVGGAIAKAVLRQGSATNITVSGDMALATADESNLVDLLGLLLACIEGLESPAVVVNTTGGNVVVSVSGVGMLPESKILAGARVWEHEPEGVLDTRLAAARSLAEASGARLRQSARGERCGFKILIPGASTEMVLEAHRETRSAAAA